MMYYNIYCVSWQHTTWWYVIRNSGWCHVMLGCAMTYHIMPWCHITLLSHHVTSLHAITCHVVLFCDILINIACYHHAIHHHILSCLTSRQTTPHHTTPPNTIPLHTMPSYHTTEENREDRTQYHTTLQRILPSHISTLHHAALYHQRSVFWARAWQYAMLPYHTSRHAAPESIGRIDLLQQVAAGLAELRVAAGLPQLREVGHDLHSNSL